MQLGGKVWSGIYWGYSLSTEIEKVVGEWEKEAVGWKCSSFFLQIAKYRNRPICKVYKQCKAVQLRDIIVLPYVK